MRIFPSMLCLAGFCAATSASAKEFKLPADKPVVTVTIPDDWRAEFIPRGLQVRTTDDDVFLSVEPTDNPKEMGTIIDESDAMLRVRKVKLDRASKRDTKFIVNGFPAEELRYIGIDDHGSVTVSFTFVTIRETAVVFTYLANEEGHQKHQTELGKIFDSVKILKAVPTPAATAQ